MLEKMKNANAMQVQFVHGKQEGSEQTFIGLLA